MSSSLASGAKIASIAGSGLVMLKGLAAGAGPSPRDVES
jgi:hypothetical protein